ncbi:hypothetical protein SESBI_34894 [Sesbania bispinosa]|nr:hypothetical protein SESBI_34894 [Sesbania bispinosa]
MADHNCYGCPTPRNVHGHRTFSTWPTTAPLPETTSLGSNLCLAMPSTVHSLPSVRVPI